MLQQSLAHNYASVFWELLRTPFEHIDLLWGIVPLYFGWIINEITSAKASFKTAIQTGFAFLWAGAHWTYQYLHVPATKPTALHVHHLLAVNVAVTCLVLIMGALALISGFRRRYPRYGSFLGHTRFSNYFMIAIFPIQSGYLPWSWARVIAISLFSIPLWFILHFGLMPLRK